MRLMRPRLLPATIAMMSALLALKSMLLVQAAAGEAAPSSAEAASSSAGAVPAPGAAPAAAPVRTPSPAASVPPPARPADAAAASVAGQSPGAGSPGEPPLQISESERTVLLSLRDRRQALDARARTLDQRAAELEAADTRLAERVRELQNLQAHLEDLEQGRQQHRAENWSGLVKTYEAMKPREAAAIFDALDMQVLLQVLDRMQERRAAPVLAAMQPDRARLATQLLAEMRTRAITPPDAPAAARSTGGAASPSKG